MRRVARCRVYSRLQPTRAPPSGAARAQPGDALRESRARSGSEKRCWRSAPDLVILDDFGLRRLTAQQNNDLYELIVERHRRASFAIITSNRSVDGWLGIVRDEEIPGEFDWRARCPSDTTDPTTEATSAKWRLWPARLMVAMIDALSLDERF